MNDKRQETEARKAELRQSIERLVAQPTTFPVNEVQLFNAIEELIALERNSNEQKIQSTGSGCLS